MSSNVNSDTIYSTPPEVRSVAEETRNQLLPDKSKKKYEAEYAAYKMWQNNNDVHLTSENVLLAYFGHLSKQKKPSTLWAIFSMLKSTLDNAENIKIGNYTKLVAFLKKQRKNFESKKSRVFTANEIRKFLEEAPDIIYLATKVVTLFGVYGACRGGEFVNIKTSHVEDLTSIILVRIPDNKTKTPRSFTIDGEMCKIIQKYAKLRPPNTNTDRFFLNYVCGKCTVQVIGKHKFEKMPKQIAEFLQLEDPQLYTGHSFRRTSATLLADAGANLTMLKRHGKWKSSAVAEGYIDHSLQNKRKISSMIGGTIFDASLPHSSSQSIVPDGEEGSSLPLKMTKKSNNTSQTVSATVVSNTTVRNTDWVELIEENVGIIVDKIDCNNPVRFPPAATDTNSRTINISNCNFYFQSK